MTFLLRDKAWQMVCTYFKTKIVEKKDLISKLKAEVLQLL